MAQLVADTQRILGQVSALAMLDDDFRANLAAAPADVLGQFGIPVPAGVTVELVTDPTLVGAATEADPTLRLYVPEVTDLNEWELSMVSGAMASCQSTAGTGCTIFCYSTLSTASTNSCS